MSRIILALALVLVLALPLAVAKDFRQALAGYTFDFPGNHSAHPDYKTEWWYYTGHLTTEDGQPFGYELTFFRAALDPENMPLASRWALTQVYPAHFAVSDEGRKTFFFAEKLNRAGIGTAGAAADTHHVWNENWFSTLKKDGNGYYFHIHADSPDYAINLKLYPEKPPVVHGKNGVSQKAACLGCASHYYSMTRLRTTGTITVDGETRKVTGLSWMDQEFGSNQLAENQVGWDWFSIQLDNDTELMLYMLRTKDGGVDPNSSGTLVLPDGQDIHLALDEFEINPLDHWQSPETGAVYPMGWRIRIPARRMDLIVTPVFEKQELLTTRSANTAYWEGSSRVRGMVGDQPVEGAAYVEMTGYAGPFRQKI